MTGNDNVPSIYDTYNAKWLSPVEVAKSFVAPSQFTMLLKRRHSLVVGPRGSGKTTLLKMLTQPALERWQGARANRLRRYIDYTGVFVATDVSWNSQVSALGSERIDPVSRRRLQMAALTAHTHKALVEAMETRSTSLVAEGLCTATTDDREIEVVSELAALWKINPPVPSYYSLRAALRRRLQQVYELATHQSDFGGGSSPESLAQHTFLAVPLLLSCRNAIEHFNDVYDERDRPWAFLFDEVELMPAAIREELYAYLRTFPGPILFKLALSPFDDDLPTTTSSASPQSDQDYDFIPLWYPKKRRAYRFCRALWDVMLRDSRFAGKRPDEVLGRSLLDTDAAEWEGRGTAYTANSPHHKYLLQLWHADKGFRRYIVMHQINLDQIDQVKGSDRASTLRKVFPLVVARVERLHPAANEKLELRSRKLSGIYTGATSIFDICEGNPRRFIGLISRLLERVPEGATQVDAAVQSDEITQAISRYRALLRTIVVPRLKADVFPKGLLSLLDPIGKRLQAECLTQPFSPEPPGTFVIDSSVDEEMVRMLGHALNAGAIVHVPDREGEEQLLSSAGIREKKFRLSYLLAANFGIPPRLGRHVSLRELLQSRPGGGENTEGTLFDWSGS